jgi:hypothetical protein
MPQAIDWALLGLAVSDGPNIMSDGHHHRSRAACAMRRCAGVPFARTVMASKPWRWWKDSSLHTRVIARAYGPYEQRVSGTWFMIAAPSTSQPMAATSAQEVVG